MECVSAFLLATIWYELTISVNYLFLWLSDGANVGTMQQAGSIVALGLSWREASVAM